jgi:hypothetical protein
MRLVDRDIEWECLDVSYAVLSDHRSGHFALVLPHYHITNFLIGGCLRNMLIHGWGVAP